MQALEIVVHFHHRQQAPVMGHFLRMQDDQLIVATHQHGGTIERHFHTSKIRNIDFNQRLEPSPDILWDSFFRHTRWLMPWLSENHCAEMLEHWTSHYSGANKIDGIIALEVFIGQLTHPDIRSNAIVIWLNESASTLQWESIIQFFEHERLDCPWRVPEVLWAYRIQAYYHLSRTEEAIHWLMRWQAVHYQGSSANNPLSTITKIHNTIREEWPNLFALKDLKPPQPTKL